MIADRNILIQNKLLKSILVAILLPVSVTEPNAAVSNPASAQLNVGATVLPYISIKANYQYSTILITQNDISRRYVDVQGGGLIEVKSNSKLEYYLLFELSNAAISHVRIDGFGKAVMLNTGSVVFPMAMDGSVAMIELNYRFFLAENDKPGVYPWPMVIEVFPK